MINLKEYNDKELSLITKLESRYQYSKKQLSILLNDIEDYKLEFNRYKFVI